MVQQLVMDLAELRGKIDKMDAMLMDILKKRFKVVEQVGGLKHSREIEVLDDDREQEVIRNCLKEGEGLDEEFIRDICRLILDESKRVQK